jgi:hypothetical protein
MLTLRQLLIVSGQNSGEILDTAKLRAQYPARPLSLTSLARGVEKQRIIVFVTLVSTRVFRTHNIESMADLATAGRTVDALISASEVMALSEMFRQQGISLRLVSRDRQSFALVGLVPSLVNAPTTLVDQGNLLHVRDKFSGGEAVGGIAAGVGGVLIGIALATSAPVWVLPVGAALLGFGAGFGITAGIMDILHDSAPAPRSDSQDDSATPNDLGPDGPGETIEVPNAVAIGSPPEGLDTPGVLDELGDFAIDFSVDMVLSDLPVGFDPGSGAGFPGGPLGGEGNGEGEGGGFNPLG